MQNNPKTTPHLNGDFITPQDLFAWLGITIGVQNKLRMRKFQRADAAKPPLPFIKIGKRVVYRRSEINQWLENIRENYKKELE